MLTRPEFLTYVEEHILEYVKDPEEKQASIRQVTKNNNISLNGLCIGKGEEVCQPIIYLDSYYEDYREGADLGEILCRIGAVYEDSRQSDRCFPLQGLQPHEGSAVFPSCKL